MGYGPLGDILGRADYGAVAKHQRTERVYVYPHVKRQLRRRSRSGDTVGAEMEAMVASYFIHLRVKDGMARPCALPSSDGKQQDRPPILERGKC